MFRTTAILLLAFFSFLTTKGQDSLVRSRPMVIDTVIVIGNKVTRPHIITRELTFREGDTVSYPEFSRQLQRSKENLLNTSLFNFVTVTPFAIRDSTILVVRIEVKERWYTWPVPIFEVVERNFNTWWLDKDFNKINYGMYLTRDNFRGRKESVSLKFRLGYSEQFGLSYNIPYLDKKQKSGLGFGVYYTRGHEIAYTSSNNKLIYFKDPDNYIRREISGRISYSYRKGLYDTHLAELKYQHAKIHDTIVYLSSSYLPGEGSIAEYFALTYRFSRDMRDSRSYPLKGYFFDAEISKLGLGLLKNEADVLFLYGSYRQYANPLYRTYISGAIRAKYSPTSNQPYYVQRGLGYRDYVRAYEYYVIDGQSYGLFKSSLKYEIIRPRIHHLKFLPFEKFNTFHYALYGGVFADIGYVQDRSGYGIYYNPLANTMLFGAGVGIDYVTYYDAVLRLEYSFNREGEKGLFLHFTAPL